MNPIIKKVKNNEELIRKAFRYLVVGVGGLAVYAGSLIALVELLKINSVISSIIAFIISFLYNYVFNYVWVFCSTKKHIQTFPKYLIIVSIAFVLNTLIMYMTTQVFSWWYIWGQISATLIIPPLNFILNNYWTFREETN